MPVASITLRAMSTSASESPLQGITYTDTLPIAWEQLAELPSEGELQRYYRNNEELLQNLLFRDDALSHDSEKEDEDSALEHFKRLESRLDLLTSLVSEMLSQNGQLPPRHTVTLSGQGLSVQTDQTDLTAENRAPLLKISLYLDPHFPRPLTLFGQSSEVQPEIFIVRFKPVEGRLQDLLDKYLFRQHRRAIALSRRSENS